MLPFNLQPAPAVRHRYVTIDLGKYSAEHEGWKVVFDIDTQFSKNIFDVADDRLSGTDRVQSLLNYLKSIIVAWNFTDTVINADGSETTEVLPQPRDGGVEKLPQTLIRPISEAYAEAVNPTKNLPTP